MRVWGWYLGIAAVLAACWFWLWTNFHLVPDPMPIHFTLDGQPDAWATKSLPSALSLTGLPTLMLGIVGAAAVGLTSVSAREAGERQKMISTGFGPVLSRWMFWISTIIVVSFTASLLGHYGPLNDLLMVSGLILSTVFFGLRIRTLYRRVSAVYPPGEKEQHMRYGFYWNRDDPDTVVSLENGMSTTLNFARPGAWGILALLLALPTLAIILGLLAG
ncbi:DUF1648 domain-containing protein [Corynebacterium sp.]|uniref:DUF1648 domain-containing protein n=1 Tax=Corynebacterium sp. TaxID=1720 RepID=UPI0019CDDE08|nr:DUF1648 domain-containing protein [Corynebacterium sp.]HHU68096.1 DUF1648 domain-containing protein [Corynebacterium sp.]